MLSEEKSNPGIIQDKLLYIDNEIEKVSDHTPALVYLLSRNERLKCLDIKDKLEKVKSVFSDLKKFFYIEDHPYDHNDLDKEEMKKYNVASRFSHMSGRYKEGEINDKQKDEIISTRKMALISGNMKGNFFSSITPEDWKNIGLRLHLLQDRSTLMSHDLSEIKKVMDSGIKQYCSDKIAKLNEEITRLNTGPASDHYSSSSDSFDAEKERDDEIRKLESQIASYETTRSIGFSATKYTQHILPDGTTVGERYNPDPLVILAQEMYPLLAQAYADEYENIRNEVVRSLQKKVTDAIVELDEPAKQEFHALHKDDKKAWLRQKFIGNLESTGSGVHKKYFIPYDNIDGLPQKIEVNPTFLENGSFRDPTLEQFFAAVNSDEFTAAVELLTTPVPAAIPVVAGSEMEVKADLDGGRDNVIVIPDEAFSEKRIAALLAALQTLYSQEESGEKSSNKLFMLRKLITLITDYNALEEKNPDEKEYLIRHLLMEYHGIQNEAQKRPGTENIKQAKEILTAIKPSFLAFGFSEGVLINKDKIDASIMPIKDMSKPAELSVTPMSDDEYESKDDSDTPAGLTTEQIETIFLALQHLQTDNKHNATGQALEYFLVAFMTRVGGKLGSPDAPGELFQELKSLGEYIDDKSIFEDRTGAKIAYNHVLDQIEAVGFEHGLRKYDVEDLTSDPMIAGLLIMRGALVKTQSSTDALHADLERFIRLISDNAQIHESFGTKLTTDDLLKELEKLKKEIEESHDPMDEKRAVFAIVASELQQLGLDDDILTAELSAPKENVLTAEQLALIRLNLQSHEKDYRTKGDPATASSLQGFVDEIPENLGGDGKAVKRDETEQLLFKLRANIKDIEEHPEEDKTPQKLAHNLMATLLWDAGLRDDYLLQPYNDVVMLEIPAFQDDNLLMDIEETPEFNFGPLRKGLEKKLDELSGANKPDLAKIVSDLLDIVNNPEFGITDKAIKASLLEKLLDLGKKQDKTADEQQLYDDLKQLFKSAGLQYDADADAAPVAHGAVIEIDDTPRDAKDIAKDRAADNQASGHTIPNEGHILFSDFDTFKKSEQWGTLVLNDKDIRFVSNAEANVGNRSGDTGKIVISATDYAKAVAIALKITTGMKLQKPSYKITANDEEEARQLALECRRNNITVSKITIVDRGYIENDKINDFITGKFSITKAGPLDQLDKKFAPPAAIPRSGDNPPFTPRHEADKQNSHKRRMSAPLLSKASNKETPAEEVDLKRDNDPSPMV